MNALWTAITTILVCLFGSGGIVLWFLNRIAKKHDAKDTTAKARPWACAAISA